MCFGEEPTSHSCSSAGIGLSSVRLDAGHPAGRPGHVGAQHFRSGRAGGVRAGAFRCSWMRVRSS